MGLFRRKPKSQPQSQQSHAPARQDAARAELAPSPRAPLDISHPVFQLELGMDTAAVVGLLGEKYLSRGGCWFYSDTPAGYDIELVFRFKVLASVEVKMTRADGNTAVLMTMDRDRVEAAPPYQAFVDRELQRRGRRSVEKVVIVHAGDELPPDELRTLVNYVETKLAIVTTGAVVRDLIYDVSPENLTLSFGMTVLALLESKGEITNDPATPAWVGEVGVNGEPRVIIVSYKQDKSQAGAPASPHPVVTPQKQVEPLNVTHPAFRLKAGMTKEQVIGLLGEDYRSTTARDFIENPTRARRDMVDIIDPSLLENEYWLYSDRGHYIEIVFRSGALASAEVKKNDADRSEALLARIDQDGLAATQPYRAALGAKKL